MCLSYLYEEKNKTGKHSGQYYETFNQWHTMQKSFFSNNIIDIDISPKIEIKKTKNKEEYIDLVHHIGLFLIGKSIYEAN